MAVGCLQLGWGLCWDFQHKKQIENSLKVIRNS